jgi:hypothetical protein
MPLTLADLTAEQRQHLEICVHEAAHAVAGVARGAELRNAVVIRGKVTGIEGLTTFSDAPWGIDPLLAYAGPYGQAKFQAGGRRPTQRAMFAVFDGGGRKDAIVLSLAGGFHTGAAVEPVIDKCWPGVIRIAQQLFSQGEVIETDVLTALGITDGGGPSSAQLAGLRSGFRRVPPITRTTKKQRAAVPA